MPASNAIHTRMAKFICRRRGHSWQKYIGKTMLEPIGDDTIEVIRFEPFEKCDRCGVTR